MQFVTSAPNFRGQMTPDTAFPSPWCAPKTESERTVVSCFARMIHDTDDNGQQVRGISKTMWGYQAKRARRSWGHKGHSAVQTTRSSLCKLHTVEHRKKRSIPRKRYECEAQPKLRQWRGPRKSHDSDMLLVRNWKGQNTGWASAAEIIPQRFLRWKMPRGKCIPTRRTAANQLSMATLSRKKGWKYNRYAASSTCVQKFFCKTRHSNVPCLHTWPDRTTFTNMANSRERLTGFQNGWTANKANTYTHTHTIQSLSH